MKAIEFGQKLGYTDGIVTDLILNRSNKRRKN